MLHAIFTEGKNCLRTCASFEVPEGHRKCTAFYRETCALSK